jgi:hypothetical protein
VRQRGEPFASARPEVDLFVPAHAEHLFTGDEGLSLLVIFTRPTA